MDRERMETRAGELLALRDKLGRLHLSLPPALRMELVSLENRLGWSTMVPMSRHRPRRYSEQGGQYDTHNQLIAAIHANREEAVPRLQLADFLQENNVPGAHIVRAHAQGINEGTRRWSPRVGEVPDYLAGHERFESSPIYSFGSEGRTDFGEGSGEAFDADARTNLGTYLQVFHGSPDRHRRGVVLAVNHRGPGEGSIYSNGVTHSAHARTTEDIRRLLADFPPEQVADIIRTHSRWLRRPQKLSRHRPRRYSEQQDEDSFHAALDANPDDHTTRLVFADWLQERGDPRAEGYRALGVQGRSTDASHPGYHWWESKSYRPRRTLPFQLPHDWLTLIPRDSNYPTSHGDHTRFRRSRREAEDAAATAFGQLPPKRQTELLNVHKLSRRGVNYGYARPVGRVPAGFNDWADFEREVHSLTKFGMPLQDIAKHLGVSREIARKFFIGVPAAQRNRGGRAGVLPTKRRPVREVEEVTGGLVHPFDLTEDGPTGHDPRQSAGNRELWDQLKDIRGSGKRAGTIENPADKSYEGIADELGMSESTTMRRLMGLGKTVPTADELRRQMHEERGIPILPVQAKSSHLSRRRPNYRYARLTLGAPRPFRGPGGEAMHEHDYHDESGAKLGVVRIHPRDDGRHLHVQWVGPTTAEPGARTGEEGVEGVHSLRDQLPRHYPDAEFVSGVRASGPKKGQRVVLPVRKGRRGGVRRYSLADHNSLQQGITHVNSAAQVWNSHQTPEYTPHLAYSDYLEDNGMPAHAEWVRRAVEQDKQRRGTGYSPTGGGVWNANYAAAGGPADFHVYTPSGMEREPNRTADLVGTHHDENDRRPVWTLTLPVAEMRALHDRVTAEGAHSTARFSRRGPQRYAKAEKDRHPAHESIRHFPIEHVLRHLANDPKNGASIRGTAKHVLTTGDTSGLWGLHDLLQDPGEHSHKGQHPVLRAGYRMMSAADKIHLDRHTRRAMEEAAEAHRAAHPEATHERHPTTGDYLGQWAPEAAAQRAAFALDDVRSGRGPTADNAVTLRRLRERTKQLSPHTTPEDVDESIRRHAFRAGHWYRDTHGIDTAYDRERALQPVEQTVKERGKIVRQSSDGHHANEKATRYRRRFVVTKYTKVNRSSFIDALRRLQSSNHTALTTAARDVSKRMGIRDTHVLGALHDGPGGAVPGVAQAVYGQVAPEKVHELAAWVNGLLPNSPGYAVFHPRLTGPDTLYRIRHDGSGMDVRTRLDRAGIKNRVLVPHRKGFDVLVPDKGNALSKNVDEYATQHGLRVEASPGHFQTVGGGDQAASRATFRNKVVAGEKTNMGRTNPRRYALPHSTNPDDIGGVSGERRNQLVHPGTFVGGPVRMEPRTGPETTHDQAGTDALLRDGHQKSGRQMWGQMNGYVQDAVEGGRLADALDERGLPHATFFRNLTVAGDGSRHMAPEGDYREFANNPHPLRGTFGAEGTTRYSTRPAGLVGSSGYGAEPTRLVVHRLGDPATRGHTALMDAPALREWAAHPKVGPSLRAHLLNAADHLESHAPPAPPPAHPDAVDHNARMSRRRRLLCPS